MAVVSGRTLISVLSSTLAVVLPGDRQLQRQLGAAGLQIVTCASAIQGMGASLACGIAASIDSDGWIIALADMPFIHPATIGSIVARVATGAAIAVPEYHGKRGHPVGFGKQFRAQLTSIEGDMGARRLLERHSAQLHRVMVDDPGILVDIDTRDDVKNLGFAQK